MEQLTQPERLHRESDAAYEAFSLYVSLGDRRSLAAVASALRKSPALIERWSSRDHWQRRVRGQDERLRHVAEKAESKAVAAAVREWVQRFEDSREKDFAVAEKLREVAMEALEKLRLKDKPPSLSDVARALTTAHLLSNRACGQRGEEGEAGPRTAVQTNVMISLPPNNR
jgi:hypothetical protein